MVQLRLRTGVEAKDYEEVAQDDHLQPLEVSVFHFIFLNVFLHPLICLYMHPPPKNTFYELCKSSIKVGETNY